MLFLVIFFDENPSDAMCEISQFAIKIRAIVISRRCERKWKIATNHVQAPPTSAHRAYPPPSPSPPRRVIRLSTPPPTGQDDVVLHYYSKKKLSFAIFFI